MNSAAAWFGMTLAILGVSLFAGCSAELADANRCQAFAAAACRRLCDQAPDGCQSTLQARCAKSNPDVVSAAALDDCIHALSSSLECTKTVEDSCPLRLTEGISAPDPEDIHFDPNPAD